MGTWVFDGQKENSITPLQSLNELAATQGFEIYYHRALELSRSRQITDLTAIMRDVQQADAVLLFIGEESILSGESHSLANIDLPGAQEELIKQIASAGKPIAAIIMAGRPVTFEKVEPYMDAVLYAWHPGTMTGPAMVDLIFGNASPSGKLPVTFPRHVGQIPIYYNHKNTGKPATDQTWERLNDIPAEAPQLSIGNTSHYLDYGFEPMYHFGFGLSYSTFEISNVHIEKPQLRIGENLRVSFTITNSGNVEAAEVVQLYTRQLFGSRTRPLKELKAFQKILLAPGEQQKYEFEIDPRELGFHNPQMEFVTEPGTYHLWVGNCSRSGIQKNFEIIR
jgi:beta-glucosidase